MRYLLQLLLLGVPFSAFAQRKHSISPLPTQIAKPPISDILRSSANLHGIELARDAMLYLQPSDILGPPTQQMHLPTRQLHPGDKVIVQQQVGSWLKVFLGNADSTGYSENDTTYYLRTSDTEGAKVFILL